MMRVTPLPYRLLLCVLPLLFSGALHAQKVTFSVGGLEPSFHGQGGGSFRLYSQVEQERMMRSLAKDSSIFELLDTVRNTENNIWVDGMTSNNATFISLKLLIMPSDTNTMKPLNYFFRLGLSIDPRGSLAWAWGSDFRRPDDQTFESYSFNYNYNGVPMRLEGSLLFRTNPRMALGAYGGFGAAATYVLNPTMFVSINRSVNRFDPNSQTWTFDNQWATESLPAYSYLQLTGFGLAGVDIKYLRYVESFIEARLGFDYREYQTVSSLAMWHAGGGFGFRFHFQPHTVQRMDMSN